jgi:hypothetical protein
MEWQLVPLQCLLLVLFFSRIDNAWNLPYCCLLAFVCFSVELVLYFSAWLFLHEYFLNIFRIFLKYFGLFLRYVLDYVLEVHEYFTLYAFQFNLCFILVLGYFCMNIFKMFLEYFWNIFEICFGICFKSTWIFYMCFELICLIA